MQDWLPNTTEICTLIETYSELTVIHKCRSKTLAKRVKIMFTATASVDPNTAKMNDTMTKGYFSMLLATLEEICDYLKILQTKDTPLGKRVINFGIDEELFSKWNETLQTCSRDLKLVVDDRLFDSDQDLQDFNQDLKDLLLKLRDILEIVPGVFETVELAVEGIQQLLEQQKADRSRYKTQVAVKAETSFKVKLIKFEKIIGIGGNFKTP